MKLTILRKKHSLFLIFLVSYLVVLIIPVVLGVISYMRTVHVVKKEMESYNMAMLQQAQQVLDERLYNVERISMDIGLNAGVQKFLYVNAPVDNLDMYNAVRTGTEIAKYKNIYSYIDDVYIYFKKTDIIINGIAKYEPYLFYQLLSRYEEWEYEEWRGMLLKNHFREFIPVQSMTADSNKREVITYLQSLPLGTNPMGTLVILINKETIENILKEINILDKGVVFIEDSSSRRIMSVGDEQLLKHVRLDGLPAQRGYFYSYSKGEEMMVSYIISPKLNGWKYVSVIPTSVFMKDVSYIRNNTVMVILIELTAGLALSVFLAKRNYLPIRRIAEKLMEETKMNQ